MTKSDIVIQTDGNDSTSNLRTYALKTTINGIDASFPTISPVQTEVERAESRDMGINSPFVTFTQHVKSLKKFVRDYKTRKSEYQEFAAEHSGKLVNYSFDLSPNEKMTRKALNVLRRVQLNAESPFFFEHEVNSEQDEIALGKQLDETKKWLKKHHSTKILVPVIDMKILKEGRFLKKLEYLSKDYSRINVIYRTPSQFLSNWADLKAFLKDNKIWCHMDCVLNRYNSDKIAHRVRLYAIGVSSLSIGFPFGGGKGKKKKQKRLHQFDANSHTFTILNPPYEPSFAQRKDRTWISSLNAEIAELQKMRQHAIAGTLYNVYIPSKNALGYLAFSEGI